MTRKEAASAMKTLSQNNWNRWNEKTMNKFIEAKKIYKELVAKERTLSSNN